jgi:hypothetical protein
MRSKSKPRTVAPPPAPKPDHPAIAALQRSRWIYLLVSLILLIPCYWQPHIEAGDLSSHIYNAWLAQSIDTGRIHGLRIAAQSTNILFDLMLGSLLKLAGPEVAQRISVSLAVLIFIWGAFALAVVVQGRKPWTILPCMAMLAYGWVFHIGFFNFYLSMGLCFWALALLWQPNARRIAAAIALLAIAYVAHALPVLWAIGLGAFVTIGQRLTERQRVYLMLGAIAAIALGRAMVAAAMPTYWTSDQFSLVTGLDQLWVYDGKYLAAVVGLLFIWVVWLLNLIHLTGLRRLISSLPFQLCAISAAAVLLGPNAITIKGYQNSLGFIAQRMSLPTGICICVLLSGGIPRRFGTVPVTVIALLFFGFLFHDERAINGFEARIHQVVTALPEGQRVISAIDDPTLHVNLQHVIDRACVGHCYSFANYEPSTAQFRVRADGPNPYVAATYADSWLLQNGAYVVKDVDVPIYQLEVDASGRIAVRVLAAGMRSGATPIKLLHDLL